MTKIKYINCFGTSYTAGGGFEFECYNDLKSKKLHEIYGKIEIEKTQYHFSWPGQLQKLVGSDIKVNNFAKSGYGNSRIFRLVYDIINDENFNSEENVFIFEFAGIGRDEFFLKEIKDYLVCNYQSKYDKNNNINFEFVGAANSYNYDNMSITNKIKNYDEFFNTYVNKFIDFDEYSDTMIRETDFFLSYLEKNNIKFLFCVSPILYYEYDNTKKIIFGDNINFKQYTNFVKFVNGNNLQITDETHQQIKDSHSGLKGNKIASQCIYNKLIESGYLNMNFIDIDWECYFTQIFI